MFALSGCISERVESSAPKVHPEVAEAREHFTFQGKPIPPFFLMDFNGDPNTEAFWVDDTGPRIAAVAVDGLFSEHNSYALLEVTSEEDGWVSGDLGNDGDGRSLGCISYRFIGTTPSGITVLETYEKGDGSARLIGVLFMRFNMETFGVTKEEKQERLVMRYLSGETWGDRVYRDIKLKGNQLWLSETRSDIPYDRDHPDPERTIIIE